MYRDPCMRVGARVLLRVRMLMYALHVHCTCGRASTCAPVVERLVRAGNRDRGRALAARLPRAHWALRGTSSCCIAADRLSAVSRSVRGARCSHARDGSSSGAVSSCSAALWRAAGAECAARSAAAPGRRGGTHFNVSYVDDADSDLGVPYFFIDDCRGMRRSGVQWPAVAPTSHREPYR